MYAKRHELAAPERLHCRECSRVFLVLHQHDGKPMFCSDGCSRRAKQRHALYRRRTRRKRCGIGGKGGM